MYSPPSGIPLSLLSLPPQTLRRLHPLTGSLMAPGSSSERLHSSPTVTRRVSPSLSPTSRPSTSSSSSSSSCRRRRRRRRRRRSPSPSSSSPSSCWWCCALYYGVRRVPVNSLVVPIHADHRLLILFAFFRSRCQRTPFVYICIRILPRILCLDLFRTYRRCIHIHIHIYIHIYSKANLAIEKFCRVEIYIYIHIDILSIYNIINNILCMYRYTYMCN